MKQKRLEFEVSEKNADFFHRKSQEDKKCRIFENELKKMREKNQFLLISYYFLYK